TTVGRDSDRARLARLPTRTGRAAGQRAVHGGDQLVDLDVTGVVAIECRAGAQRSAAERDVDAQHQLADVDIAAAVAIADAGELCLSLNGERRPEQTGEQCARTVPKDCSHAGLLSRASKSHSTALRIAGDFGHLIVSVWACGPARLCFEISLDRATNRRFRHLIVSVWACGPARLCFEI